jgi:hypothetical protein
MGVEKLSVSFELDLGAAIRESASRAGVSVSAWLAESAAVRLRQELLGDAIATWERRYGKLTAQEIADADHVIERSTKKRSAKRKNPNEPAA